MGSWNGVDEFLSREIISKMPGNPWKEFKLNNIPQYLFSKLFLGD